MDENATRYARRILMLHLLALVLVLAVVVLAVREIYRSTRDEVMQQAKSRQALLANQTARGIESHYQSILNTLDLLRRAENEDSGNTGGAGIGAAANSPNGPVTMPAPGGPSNTLGEPPSVPPPLADRVMSGPRGGMLGPMLWKQLGGRVSLLFNVDRNQLSKTSPTIRVVGASNAALLPDAVVQQSRAWLEKVEKPSLSEFQMYNGIGANLVCIPFPRGRLMVAVVPIKNIEGQYLQSLNDDPETGAWLIDDRMIAMAATRPELTGASMQDISDVSVRSLVASYIREGKTGSEIVTRSLRIGTVNFAPSMFSAEPIAAGGRTWELFVATSLNRVDGILSRLFQHALLWGGFVVISITAILVSTAVQLIRSRLRLERDRHQLLTKEVNQAREIQLAWLPERRPQSSAIDIAAVNSPASHISGDFYNWFDLPDGRIVILIGDVTGHGMSAAFLMATTQLLVRNTMDRLKDPGACLEEVNHQLCVQVFNGQFVTMNIMLVDTATGMLLVATAGHPRPLLADGESFQPLPLEPQLPLGVEKNARYTTESFELPPRASIVLYTDGVVDCVNASGHRFSSDSLHRTLYGEYPSAQTMLDHVVEEIQKFRGPCHLSDDLTMVAIQLQTSPLRRAPLHAMV